ncbi:amino acid ABC transporter permease (plasmid) [Pantoea cypripedii]|uniref:Amino acid ABC transporter permease n=2 Tax=Pantoea cypripedii TaxID=55209 RepID=A0A6B9GG62_PANCY|nr:amino acid ABC transporter permease [Pantoea cypripedii]
MTTEHSPIKLTHGRVGFKWRVTVTWLLLGGFLLSLLMHMGLDYQLIAQKLPFMLGLRLTSDGFIQGAAMTLVITLISMFCSLSLAILVASGRLSKNPFFFGCATFYASLFRGTPLLVQVLIIYLALPQAGIILDAFTSGILALSLNYGAYMAETVRSGVLAVPAGQIEAGLAIGLGRKKITLYIVIPQALRIIIPPLGSLFISMLKDSSLVSLLGLWELNFLAQSYGRSTYHYMEMLLTAAAIYWLMSIVFEMIQVRLEHRYSKGYL